MKTWPAARQSRWRRAAVGCAFATLVTCPPRLSRADPPIASEGEPTEALKGRARALFQEGNSLLDAGDYRGALRRFEQARTLWDNPKIELNIATTQRALGKNAAAANAYSSYLKRAAPDSPNRAEVERILGALSSTTGRVVLSNPSGIDELTLDGDELSVTAEGELWVEPGEHVLTVKRRREVIQHPFRVGAAEVLRIDLRGSRKGTSPMPAPPPAAGPKRTAASLPDAKPAGPAADRVLGLTARVDFDPLGGGALAAAGVGIGLTEHFRLTGGALIGATRGGWMGLDYRPWRSGRVQSFVGVAAPAFYVESLYTGVSAHCGLGYQMTQRVVPFVQVAFVHFPEAPLGYVRTVFVPAAGIEVPL
jgi:hypothetical protein